MSWESEDWQYDPESMFDLSGRRAIVTGAGSGLGRAIALGLDARGATVVVADIDGDAAWEVADVCTNGVAMEVDVTDESSLRSLRDRVRRDHREYQILCNVPGINTRKPVFDLSFEEWREIIQLNLNGMFKAVKILAEPIVDAGDGSVINMASVRGIDGGANQSAYSASKSGVIQLTKVLAAEWAPDVRVNALAPGYIKTPLVREAMSDQEWYERMREGHLLNRFGEPEEVAGAAVFLASDAASFVTGSILTVDGGWTAH
ncbi:3-oxoacyl-ACP reductase [Halobellus salinus]|uniref:3-oxoacyl-ACP reductase n=1 Tax=Halobellus salinus TaxID=931585 RepID=A0A830ER06_9EURY|nr:SDR family NAD(P)-dependent oxidoreductase [Halobellus salinus]GGJ01664.1 3-oxoacyl-ACP reductase [Halobellus salinus]SMP18338.1 2-deoxy-D-gluconate 3-dehydrogenase [Halobellus salinus]